MKNKQVTLVCGDENSCLETIAFRGVLEYLGFVVSTHWIGNKEQFLSLLEGHTNTDDILLLSCHGDEEGFHIPTDEIVSYDEIKVNLPKKIVVSVGCETRKASDYFMKGNCNAYIAPKNSPEGNDSLLFVVKLFWLVSQGKTFSDAFSEAQSDMPKESEFLLCQKS